MLKRLLQIFIGLGLIAGMATPAAAQLKREGYEFLEAVKKRDGTKATEMLREPGNVLINSRDISTGESALHIVVQRRDATWVRFLLQEGANPNVESKAGVTPLELAVQLGFVEGVDILAAAGAQVDTTDIAGETPLIAAVHRRDIEMIRALVKRGANPARADNSGRTARDYAAQSGPRSQVLEELDKAIAEKGTAAKSYGPN